MKNISSKQIIMDVSSMKGYARQLLDKQNDYNDLLKALLAREYYHDDDLPIPSLKELAEVSKIKYNKVRKYLNQIYAELTKDADETELRPFSFNKIEYIFFLYGYKKAISFKTDSLPIIPRKGENICIPFFKGLVGSYDFYVDDT